MLTELYRLYHGDKTFTLCIGQKRIVYSAVTNKPKVAIASKEEVSFSLIIN